MRQFLAFVLAPFILFCTAVPPEVAVPDYLVTGITVTCPGSSPAERQFTDQQTMRKILDYLRFVPLQGQAEDDSIDPSLPHYTIQLTHIDGHVTEYRQLGAEYLSKHGSAWYCLDPELGKQLEELYCSG